MGSCIPPIRPWIWIKPHWNKMKYFLYTADPGSGSSACNLRLSRSRTWLRQLSSSSFSSSSWWHSSSQRLSTLGWVLLWVWILPSEGTKILSNNFPFFFNFKWIISTSSSWHYFSLDIKSTSNFYMNIKMVFKLKVICRFRLGKPSKRNCVF